MRINFVQSVIDFLRGKEKISDSLFEILLKRNEFEEEKLEIDTIVLGSSHGACSFNPSFFKGKAFNLASTSQDLYYSYKVYNHIYKDCKKLKNVILFCSVFSPGFEVQRSTDKAVSAYFKYLFNIDYKFPEEDTSLQEYGKICAKMDKKHKITLNKNGYFHRNFFIEDMSLSERCKGHLRENMRENNQIEYIEKLSELCHSNKHSLLLVLSPATSDYRNSMPEKNILFEKLFTIANRSYISILDLYSCTDFEDSDFGDFDHMNESGAIKISKKIDNFYLKRK